jgi:hypothetical protein
LAELNQELFDKLFGNVATLDELKAKSKKMLKTIACNASRPKVIS